ncbi:MAG: MerR family transcriptional regulator [Acidimicrobiales bacterium]
MESDDAVVTIDELAAAAATTTRRIRSFQTLGLLPHPDLRGRTGLYGPGHHDRLAAILRLQEQGFSLESIGVLFRALDAGRSLSTVLGLAEPATRAAHRAEAGADAGTDSAELYGFAQLQPAATARGGVPPLLSLVPTTVWDESEAS